MSTKKEQENEEMFEDCPKAVKEYEAESGVKSFIKKPYVEFFIQSLNYFDDYEVKNPKRYNSNLWHLCSNFSYKKSFSS